MKKILVIVLIVLGAIIGSALGDLCATTSALKWLAIGGTIGFKDPIVLNLTILQLTLGFWCKLNIGGLIGIIFMAFISKKVVKWVNV